MTAYTKTIKEYLYVDSAETPNKWGTLVWGTNKWRYGDYDLGFTIGKNVSNSLVHTTSIPGKDISRQISETIVFTDSVSKEATISIYESLSLIDEISKQSSIKVSENLNLTGDTVELEKQTGIYNYIFSSESTNAKNRSIPTYSEAGATTSWTSGVISAPSWASI